MRRRGSATVVEALLSVHAETGPKRAQEHPAGRLRQAFPGGLVRWEQRVTEFENLAREALPDSIKRAIIMERAPPALRLHLLVNAQTWGSCVQVRGAIEAYVTAGRRWARDGGGGPTSMEVDALVGHQQKGKGQQRGKDKKGKQKGNAKKGSDGQQKQAGLGAARGHCGKCGRWGHKQRECHARIHALEDVMLQAGLSGGGTAATPGPSGGYTGSTGDAHALVGCGAHAECWLYNISERAPRVSPGGHVAFMHRPVDGQVVLVDLPPEVGFGRDDVWKLKRVLYGLHCAASAFQRHLGRLLRDVGFHGGAAAQSVNFLEFDCVRMSVEVDDPHIVVGGSWMRSGRTQPWGSWRISWPSWAGTMGSHHPTR